MSHIIQHSQKCSEFISHDGWPRRLPLPPVVSCSLRLPPVAARCLTMSPRCPPATSRCHMLLPGVCLCHPGPCLPKAPESAADQPNNHPPKKACRATKHKSETQQPTNLPNGQGSKGVSMGGPHQTRWRGKEKGLQIFQNNKGGLACNTRNSGSSSLWHPKRCCTSSSRNLSGREIALQFPASQLAKTGSM